MRNTLLIVVAAVTVMLVAGAGIGLAVVRLRDQKRVLAQRIESVTATHMRARPAQGYDITRRHVSEPRPLLAQVARLFGYDPSRSDEGLRWYFVLPATLAVACIAAEMTVSLLGDLRYLVAPPLWVMLSRSLWSWRREKRLGLLRMQFPDALSMIVRSVRIGIPVSETMRIVATESPEPTASCFAAMANEIAIGVPLETALPALAERAGLSDYRFFATAINLQAQTGGALSETLENLADVIRRRIALRARGHALSGEARASSFVLAVLPLMVGGALYVLNPQYIGVLFSDPQGRQLLSLAAVALCCGLYSMHIIIKRVLAS